MDVILSETNVMKRKLKSLTERILFIDSYLMYDKYNFVEAVKCKILGSRNFLYELKIWKDNNSNNITNKSNNFIIIINLQC